MEKKPLSRYRYGDVRSEIFKVMKCLTFFLVLFTFYAFTDSYSQNTKLKLNLKQASLLDVIEAIENQSEFVFLYANETLPVLQKVKGDIRIKNKNIGTVLDQVIDDGELIYMVNERQVVLRKGKDRTAPEPGSNLKEALIQTQISGSVTDANGAPLPGASIVEKGTANGSQTDFDGNFALEVSDENAVLVISYIGYSTKEIPLGGRTSVAVTLQESAAGLDEVVVIGYGSVKKSDLTGSVVSVTAEEITQLPSVRIDDALQGRAAGLQITSTGSGPGTQTTIRIRGSNSLNSSNEPLYVIDGFIGGGDLNSINTSDIQSIEVLKDASATAIYGSRGSNGVIIITTIRGRKGQKAQLRYNSYVSIQTPIKRPLLPNGPEFAAISNETAEFQNPTSPVYDPKFNPNNVNINTLQTTDWWEESTRDAILSSHTISVTGGAETTSYYFSGNFFNQEGLYKDNELERIQFKANLDQEIGSRLKMGFSSQISQTRTDEVGINPGFLGINYRFNPTVPVFDSDGNFAINDLLGTTDTDNPVAEQKQRINELVRTRILGTAYGEFEILDGLKYKLSLGVDIDNGKRGVYTPNTLTQERNNGTAEISTFVNRSILAEHTLNFNTELGENDRLDVIAGYTRQTRSNETFDARVRDFVTNLTTFNNLDGGALRDRTRSQRDDDGLESWLLRANYGLNDEFLFTFSARADAASQFSPNNKWAFFPSGAIAWRADKYLSSEVFPAAKLRISYGEVGNIGIGRYSSLARVQQRSYVLGVNQDLAVGFRQSSLVNPELKWETTSQFNVGADLGFFNNRLNISVDYYDKTTNDLIAAVPVPTTSGVGSFLLNLGSIRNSGWEFTVGSTNIYNPTGFTWTTDFNISTNKNEVIDIAAEGGSLLVNGAFLGAGGGDNTSSIIEEGKPIGLFYGYVQDGLWNTQNEIDSFPGASTDTKILGGPRWVDTNEDGVVDADDRQIIGDSNPDFFGGITNTFTYKNFDLSAFLQFTVGGDILNFARRAGPPLTDRSYRNRWTPTNTDTNIPRAGGTPNSIGFSPATSWIEDGSFLRLRTLTLGYKLPVEKIEQIASARLYATASNLFTVTDYSGFDPDVNTQGGSFRQGPFAAANVTRGYDFNTNPSSKIFTLGLDIKF